MERIKPCLTESLNRDRCPGSAGLRFFRAETILKKLG